MHTPKSTSGFSLIELIISFIIIFIMVTIVFNAFIAYKENQALVTDTETIVTILRQARNQTLNSQNSTSYGVHITASKITLFVGTTYIPNASTNQDFLLTTGDTVLTITLAGSGSDVVFNRLSGETAQSGSIVLTGVRVARTKAIQIYKTGLVEQITYAS